MKVLITGATGLVGQQLVSQCNDLGWDINFLTTSRNKLNQSFGKGFYWNPNNSDIDVNCIDGVDVIFHLAGSSVSKRWTSAYKKEILNSRLQSTKLLFSLLKDNQNQVKQFVSASAIGIYPSSFSHYYNEDDQHISKDFLGEVVEQWEDTVDELKSLNITVSKIRIGLVLAKEGGALIEMAKPIKFGLGAAFGNGLQWQSWIHIKDLAAMFCYIAQNNLSGIYNGVAPDPVTNKYLTKAIAEVLKKLLWLPNVPKLIMKLILGEMHVILFNSQRVSADKILNNGFQFEFKDIETALQDLLL